MEFRKDPKEETVRYANVILFGPSKSGKTTGAATAPGLIGFLNTEQPDSTEYAHMLDTENRIRELEMPKDPKPLLSEVMRSCYPKVGEGFDTWVLDSIGELHRRLLVSRSKGAVRPTLDAYGDVAREVEDFCRFMVEAPCNFVMVAHEHGTKNEVTGANEVLPWCGTTNPSLAQKLLGMVNVIGYTGSVRVADEENEGQTKTVYVAQIVPTQGRPTGVRGRFNALITPEVASTGVREVNIAEWMELAKPKAPPAEEKPKTRRNTKKEEAAA